MLVLARCGSQIVVNVLELIILVLRPINQAQTVKPDTLSHSDRHADGVMCDGAVTGGRVHGGRVHLQGGPVHYQVVRYTTRWVRYHGELSGTMGIMLRTMGLCSEPWDYAQDSAEYGSERC